MYYFKRAAALIMAFALSVSTAVAVTACNFSSKKNGDKSTDAASHSSWQSDQSVGGQSGGQSADHSVGQSTAYSQGGGQSAGQSTSASQSAGQSAWQSTSASQSGGQSAEQSTSASQSAGQSAGQSTSTSQSTSDGGATVVDNDALISYAGVSESAYVIWSDDTAANAKAYYKKSDEDVYTQADDRLIREAGQGRARVDYPGLAAGEYDFKIDVGSSDKDIVVEKVLVTAYDRSGYAHFGYTAGVGAYNDDGTLKDGAVVVYVDENNKNTVTANGATGIAAVIKSATTVPVCVRIIGRVASDTKINANEYEGKYEVINGLNEKANTGDGTLWGLLNAERLKDVTLEGVGDDAELYQWGITWKRCSSIEVRNLTFTDYPEDACCFDGGSNTEYQNYGNCWVHNNTFNVGKRLFDDSDDKDKAEGDGAIDVRYCHNVTYSYNIVAGCHKTGLVGGSNANLQYNITYHHNYFLNNYSRMPLGRQANIHYYNNYFCGAKSTTMDLRANAYAFSEFNYFENCKNPVKVDNADTTAVKSFGNVFDNCSGTNAAVEVTDREETVLNTCTFGNTFDTDPVKFYYDAANKASKVAYLTSAEQAKADCIALAGPCKRNAVG